MRNIQTIFSLSTIIFAMVVHSNSALAAMPGAGSIEFMCKAKAKEVAAETYSGCVNDNKQAELERIRKEYQDELAQVKAKYNSELQGLTGGAKKAKTSSATSAAAPKAARGDMPAKKMKTSKVRVEKIDFSSDRNERVEESQPETNQNDLGAESNADSQNLSSAEIVEIPAQEE